MIFSKSSMKLELKITEAIRKLKNLKKKVELQKFLDMFIFLRQFIPEILSLVKSILFKNNILYQLQKKKLQIS